MGGPTGFLNQPFGYGGGDQTAQQNEQFSFLGHRLKADISASGISDVDKEALMERVKGGTPYGTTQEAHYAGIIETLKAKKGFSEEVARIYREAVDRASKTQSTVLTRGTPAAIAPQGNSTSLITSGSVGSVQ